MIQEGKESRSVLQSETKGARRATEVSDLRVDPEVPSKHTRHRHTENYKREVIAKVAELRELGTGQIGNYLRSEGIYFSMALKWEKKFKQENGTTVREKNSREALEEKVKALEKELLRTQKKLAKSEMIIEIQKKISEMMNLGTE
jgi:transposase